MKGIAIPYIIAIVLGVIVLGLIGYWFFSTGGKLAGTIEPGCEELEERYCIEWKASGFSVEPIINKWREECTNGPPSAETCADCNLSCGLCRRVNLLTCECDLVPAGVQDRCAATHVCNGAGSCVPK